MTETMKIVIKNLKDICNKYFEGYDHKIKKIKFNGNPEHVETYNVFKFYDKNGLQLFSINQKGEINLKTKHLRRLDTYAIFKLSTFIRFSDLENDF